MKVRTKSRISKATREFTDREEPRAAFWREYEAVKAELSGECNVHVLSYYGIGGIGKTRLLKKLAQEMEERIDSPIYAYVDFDITQESRKTLERLKNKLAERSKFTFPLFELGLYVYAKKTGEKADSPEIQQITDKSPLLKLMLSVAGNIPVLGLATNVLSLADQGITYIRNYLNMHRRELASIETMEPEELYKHLPTLFALDMERNMEDATEPVVVLFDTYERLVNELGQVGEPLKNDEWIRGEDGLVQNIPGVLWVIAGREKLKWERFDPEWRDSLSQHILGNLSLADSVGFLEKAGVSDASLREGLYELTQGTPVYLDLCVDQYIRMTERGETPDISMFGKDTYDLIERFARYMGDAQKDYVYLLSCLRAWDDGLVMEIAGSVLSNFSITAYEKTKDFSFIIESDGEYTIHQTVGKVLLKNCPEVIKTKTGRVLIEKFESALTDASVMSDRYAQALYYTARGIMLESQDRVKLFEAFLERLHEPILNLLDAGKLERAKPIIDMLSERASDNVGDVFHGEMVYMQGKYAQAAGDYNTFLEKMRYTSGNFKEKLGELHWATLLALLGYSSALDLVGDYPQALEIQKSVYEAYLPLFGEEDTRTVDAMNLMAFTYGLMGEDKKALELREKVLEVRRAKNGEDHDRTVDAMNNIATSLSRLGEYEKAIELLEEVVEKRRRTLGDRHLQTANAMNNLATTLSNIDENERAVALQREVVAIMSEHLGEAHPDTLTAMNNLAAMLCDVDANEEAIEISKSVLEKRTETLGEEHLDTVFAMESLAIALERLGQPKEALELKIKVFDARTALLGEKHHDTLMARGNLASSYAKMGDLDKALELESEVFETRLEELGAAHPQTKHSYQKVVAILEDLEALQTAYEVKEMFLKAQIKAYGEAHPECIATMKSMALTCGMLGDYKTALAIQQTAYTAAVEALGEDDIETVKIFSDMAISLAVTGQTEVALEVQLTALRKISDILGGSHPQTIYAMRLTASILDALDRKEEAQQLMMAASLLESQNEE